MAYYNVLKFIVKSVLYKKKIVIYFLNVLSLSVLKNIPILQIVDNNYNVIDDTSICLLYILYYVLYYALDNFTLLLLTYVLESIL